MSGSLRYLMAMRLKNQLKSLIRSPAKLVYAVILLALLVFVLISGQMGSAGSTVFRDSAELGAIVMAYYILMFTLTANNGFSTGASVFKMSDVNLLFAGPFSQGKVLFYGLFQQLGTSILMGFFVLFQYAWVHSAYGGTFGGILVILVGYGLTVFSGQLCAMLIYALTASDGKKRAVARTVFVVIPAAYALWLFLTALSATDGILPALVGASETLAMRLYPVGGWLGGAVAGALGGDWGALARAWASGLWSWRERPSSCGWLGRTIMRTSCSPPRPPLRRPRPPRRDGSPKPRRKSSAPAKPAWAADSAPAPFTTSIKSKTAAPGNSS